MNIRRAQLSDLDYILECLHGIGKQEASINSHFIAEGYITNAMKSEIAGEIVNENYIVLIGEENNERVGVIYGYIQKKSDFWKYKKIGWIDYIFIVEKYRNQGKAQILFEEIFEHFKKKGAEIVRLKVLQGNREAMSLYEKLGFSSISLTCDKKL